MDTKGIVLTWLFFFTLVALVFFITRAFARLAAKYNKTRWVYAFAQEPAKERMEHAYASCVWNGWRSSLLRQKTALAI